MPLGNHVLRRGYAAIRFAKVLDVKRLWWVGPDSLKRIDIAPGYEIRQPSRDEFAAAIESGAYPQAIGSPERLDDPSESLLTAHRGGELAAFMWFTSSTVLPSQNYSRAPHLGTPLRLPPQTAFAYNAWTSPAHRGRRLVPALASHAATNGGCGAAGLVTTTDWTNAAAAQAFARVGFAQIGWIYRLGWPGCNATWAPGRAAEMGIDVGGDACSERRPTKV